MLCDDGGDVRFGDGVRCVGRVNLRPLRWHAV
jgi:hypothetical protein